MATSGVVDYSFALGVASALVGLVMVALGRVPALAVGKPMRDTVTQILLFVVNLAAVFYTATAAHQLDLSTGLLAYIALALGPTALHVAVKYNPPSATATATATAVSGATDPATVASVTSQVQSGVAQALASGN